MPRIPFPSSFLFLFPLFERLLKRFLWVLFVAGQNSINFPCEPRTHPLLASEPAQVGSRHLGQFHILVFSERHFHWPSCSPMGRPNALATRCTSERLNTLRLPSLNCG